jgi:AcrR family transcriptional regulator
MTVVASKKERMDNSSRSERTRNAVLEAAITIIVRDGPNRLTLDAIARESGVSKGGLMHQFHSKEAVLKALLDRQNEHFGKFSVDFREKQAKDQAYPELKTQIATLQEALNTKHSIAAAILGVIVQEPDMLAPQREKSAEQVEAIKAEAPDPDLALLRWLAARGMVFTALMDQCPLSDQDRERLFARLMDDSRWKG